MAHHDERKPGRRARAIVTTAWVTAMSLALVLAAGVVTPAAARRAPAAPKATQAPRASVAPAVVDAQVFRFDGKSLEDAVNSIASGVQGELVSYGTIRADGVLRQGELWMVVRKDKRDVYYHLSEVKEPAGSSGAYQGYRALLKAQLTTKYFPAGKRHDVPLVGNTSSAHATTEWRIFQNSTLTASAGLRTGALTASQVRPASLVMAAKNTAKTKTAKTKTAKTAQKKTAKKQATKTTVATGGAGGAARQGRTGASASAAAAGGVPTQAVQATVGSTLVEKGTLTQTMQLPTSSAGQKVYLRAFRPNGNATGPRQVVTNFAIPYGSSPDCSQVGDTVEASASWVAGAAGATATWQTKATALAVGLVSGGSAGAAAGGPGGAVAGGAAGGAAGVASAATAAELIIEPLTWAGQNLAAPFWGWVARETCLQLNPPPPSTISIPIPPRITVAVSSPDLFGEFGCVEAVVVGTTTGTYTDEGVEISYSERIDCVEYGWVSA